MYVVGQVKVVGVIVTSGWLLGATHICNTECHLIKVLGDIISTCITQGRRNS